MPPVPADCSRAGAAAQFSILTGNISTGLNAPLTALNATGMPQGADFGLTGSLTIDTGSVVSVAGMVRWLNAQNLSNAGTLIDTGLTQNDTAVSAINAIQGILNALLALPGTPLANTLVNQTVDIAPGVTVCSSSLTAANVVFNLTGGPTDNYLIVIQGDATLESVTMSGTPSPNVTWAVQGSVYLGTFLGGGSTSLLGTIFFSGLGGPFQQFVVQAGNPVIDLGRILGAVGTALVVDDNTSLSVTTPLCATASPVSQVIQAGSSGARFKPCVKHSHEWILAQLAEELRQERERKSLWPYGHLFPISDDLTVNAIADIPAPAQDGNFHVVLQYQVPSGFYFWMEALLQDGPQPFLPGDAFWVVDQNAQVASSTQAARVQGLNLVPVPLGSIETGIPWRFRMPYLFEPLTVIRSKVMNVNFAPGNPDFFTSIFLGFLVPVPKEQSQS